MNTKVLPSEYFGKIHRQYHRKDYLQTELLICSEPQIVFLYDFEVVVKEAYQVRNPTRHEQLSLCTSAALADPPSMRRPAARLRLAARYYYSDPAHAGCPGLGQMRLRAFLSDVLPGLRSSVPVSRTGFVKITEITNAITMIIPMLIYIHGVS